MNKISRRDFLKVAGVSAAALGLTACGASSTAASKPASVAAPAAPSTAAASSAAAGGTLAIGFAQVGHESDWRAASTNSAQDVFSAANGYDLQFNDADNDSAAQLEAVRGFIEQQVDYIIVDPIVATGWDTVLQEASDAGIPVFIIDRTVEADDSLYVAWFGSDFTAEGISAGVWLKSYLEAKGKTGDINICVIAGTNGSSAQLGRTEGFDKVLAENTSWKKLDEQDGQFTQDGGQQIMESFLKSYDKIDVVVCQNDNEAFGAMDALKAAGKTYGKSGDVIIISFDATNAGLTEVMNGNINADFECNPMAAPFVAEAIQKLASGGSIANKINYVDEACFACDDTVASVDVSGTTKEMTVVTQEVLDARPY
jgi:ABC-type sugar transport system substrate-binding protein